MEDFEIPEEELNRLRKEAEERHRAEQAHRRESAQPIPNDSGPDEPVREKASACPKCGFSFSWDGIRWVIASTPSRVQRHQMLLRLCQSGEASFLVSIQPRQ
jgi:hypothetical protein